jgi:COP9 signalosome complex subunit 6
MAAPNPLVVSSPSDVTPQLHPLVLLNISDYVTRQALREFKGPIAGIILGQQNGREVTMEVAFDCKVVIEQDGSVHLDQTFFEDRLELYKEVFKAPLLDVVGWYALGSTSGPEPRHLPIQMQLQTKYNLESAILLLFHPEMVAESSGAAGKLPLTLYETTWTSDSSSMDVDAGERNQSLKFRELRYSVETGEAEMISVDFVARGGGNATAVEAKKGDAKKGKGKAKETNGKTSGEAAADISYLSAEEDERKLIITALINTSTNNQYSNNLPHRQSQRHQNAPNPTQPPLHLPRQTPTIIPHRCLPPRRSHK